MTYSWTTLPDGRISVNNVIIVPDDATSSLMKSAVIDRWGPIVEPVAAAEGVPAPWIYGFIASESYPMGNPYSVSSAAAQGLMQIMPANFSHFYGRPVSAAEMQDPTINITTGARMLADKRRRGLDLPTAAAEYNVGHISKSDYSDWGMYAQGCPPNDKEHSCYISNVVTRANYAYDQTPLNPLSLSGVSTSSIALGGLALLGGASLLGYFAWKGGYYEKLRAKLRA